MIEVTLRVAGVDLEDPQTGDILGEHFPMLLWQGEGAHPLVSFEVDESNAPAEVLEQVRALEVKFPSFRAVRVERDLVSASDIAVRVGVSREAVRKWSLGEGFPVPLGTISGNMNVWLWTSVMQWLHETRGIVFDERVPNEAMLVQIDNCLMRNPDATSIQWHTLGLNSPTKVHTGRRDVVYMESWTRRAVKVTPMSNAVEVGRLVSR